MYEFSEQCLVHGGCLVAKAHPTLCDPRTISVHGISQAKILEWVAISFSRGSFRPRDWTCVSCVSCIGRWILYCWATGKLSRTWCCCEVASLSRVRLCATPWTVAHQAPLSMGFSWQEYWNRLPCPPPVDLPNPRIEPASLRSPALAGRFFTTSAIWYLVGGSK